VSEVRVPNVAVAESRESVRRLLLTAEECAAALGTTRQGLYRLVERGEMLPWRNLSPEDAKTPWMYRRWILEEVRDWCHAGFPDPKHWEWKPARPIKLETYIASLRAEAKVLLAEVEDAKARQARGETHTNVRIS
jgi:hypothetical protein